MMAKKILTAVLVGFVLVSVGFLLVKESGQGSSAPDSATVAGPTPGVSADATPKLIAYYFYGMPRCATCRRIETYTAEALQNGFVDEIKNGRLEWRPVNVEEPGNEHYMKDYELYTKSVVLVESLGGNEVRWKNLNKIWDLNANKDAFQTYIREETLAYLEKE